MIKLLICLLWGHKPWVTLEKTEYKAIPGIEYKGHSQHGGNIFLKLAHGVKYITVTCPRCNKIRTIAH